MWNLAGNFKYLVVFFFVLVSVRGFAADDEFKFTQAKWDDFANDVSLQKEKDRRNGLSYIISGSLALVGGVVGSSVSGDTAEQGIYTIFQTIGIASIGYGAYTWKIGGEERSVFQTLQYTKLTNEQKGQFLKAYNFNKKEVEKKDRSIRAVTHGLIAALNFYNASQQKQESLKNTLFFIGGVNLLAAVSFTFEF